MMHNLGIISMCLFTLCFIPQIITILRTKNVSGISLGLWMMVVGGYVFGLLYVTGLKVKILILSYSVGLTLSMITAALVIFFRNKSK